jgi:hypothetical protein
MRKGILIGFTALLLAAQAHAEDLTIDTRCQGTDRCTTYIEKTAPGITVIPPVPHDSVLMCAGTRCFTAPALEHLPIEREHEREQAARRR